MIAGGGGATIFALASGRGRAGIGVIRISGVGAGTAISRLTGQAPPPPRRATLCAVRDDSGELIDRGLVLWFPAPASFTGEDVGELHLHGGPAVIRGVLEALGRIAGMRPAEPGEFTQRAFVHGKLDLTAAEGLADLVAAETQAQRRQALRQLAGDLGQLYESWRGRALTVLAHLEASIDFSDEDLPPDVDVGISDEISALAQAISAHLDDAGCGERIREGIEIAVIGPPNVGKSTLVNAIARREVAIVSPRPGTTRDVIEVPLDIGGFPVVFCDTAGIASTVDAIEAEGIRRAEARARAADLRLAVFDAAVWPKLEGATLALCHQAAIVVLNKADLRGPLEVPPVMGGRQVRVVSARTGAGLNALRSAIEAAVTARYAAVATPPLTRLRHRQALVRAQEGLLRATAALSAEERAEEVRLAMDALARITGRVDVEEMLGIIFRDFCIGK